MGPVRPRIAILISLFLAACGQDVRTLRVDDVDLADMAVVQQLAQQLDAEDRTAFTTFAAIHGRAASGNCGLTRDGRQPETIGEAIELMRARIAQLQPDRVTTAIALPADIPAPSLAEVTEMTRAAGR